MIRRALAVVATALLSVGCAHAPRALHQGDSTFDRSLTTYAVKYHPVGSDRNTRHIFETAVHDAMAAKGYKQAEAGAADMVINFTALSKSEASDVKASAGVSAELDHAGSGEDVDKVVMVTIEGTKTDEIMWAGWSTGAYDEIQVLPKTREAVAAILVLIPAHAPGAPGAPAGS